MNPVIILGAACALLTLALAGVGNYALGLRDERAALRVELLAAESAATACSDGVSDLEQQATQRARDAAPKREQARQAAQTHDKRADAILAEPPAVPGDSCRSAEAAVDTWWKARK